MGDQWPRPDLVADEYFISRVRRILRRRRRSSGGEVWGREGGARGVLRKDCWYNGPLVLGDSIVNKAMKMWSMNECYLYSEISHAASLPYM